jgi:crotonobetainyl-CoA:carnitine CoA-transferase CaiB-like acyl-CoA transferase
MSGPLEGLVVADFTQLAQGPFATQILGDMGAEIIKIEPPKGDWMRHWSMANLYKAGEGVSFLAFNRNKRSIALDLKHERGREVALRLIGAADVVVENFRPGVMERLGLGWETLHERYPRLIYCASSGWGQSGPYVKRPGQDLLVQAVSGIGYLNGHADGPPMGLGVGAADFTAGFHIVYGILAALYSRQHTGQGQRVDVNLLNSLMQLHCQEYAIYLNGAGLPQRSRSDIPGAYLGAPYGYYETADGYIAIAMNSLSKLAALTGVPGYEQRHETQTMEDRDAVRADFATVFPTRTTDQWLDILLAEDIWCAPVNDFAAVEEDPQVAENEMIVTWEHPTAGPIRGTGLAVRFDETPGGITRPAPLLGQHTEALLRERGGFSDEEIGHLVAEGVVFQGKQG